MANTMRKNTDVGARGGAARSSVEAFVMKVDSAYASQNALIHSKAPRARDFTNQRTRRAGGEVDEVQRGKNRNKSKIPARVEHVFAVVKRLWGFTKVRYRGLAKNANRAFVALALANVYLSRRQLMASVRP
ncbi:IS5 family transposase [Paraburkholderia sp. RAU6.4a]